MKCMEYNPIRYIITAVCWGKDGKRRKKKNCFGSDKSYIRIRSEYVVFIILTRKGIKTDFCK